MALLWLLLASLPLPALAQAVCGGSSRMADGRTLFIASWPEEQLLDANTPQARLQQAAARVCFQDVASSNLSGCATVRVPIANGQFQFEGKTIVLGSACGGIPVATTSVAAIAIPLNGTTVRKFRAYAESADGLRSVCIAGEVCDKEYTVDLRPVPPPPPPIPPAPPAAPVILDQLDQNAATRSDLEKQDGVLRQQLREQLKPESAAPAAAKKKTASPRKAAPKQ